MNKKFEEQNKKIEEQKKKIEEQEIKIEEQNKKIEDLEKKVKYLDEENNKIKTDFKNELISLKKVMKELKLEKKPESELNPLIISNNSRLIEHNQFKQLNNWINPLKSLTFKLLFKATLNGDNCKKFHSICD